MQLANAYISAVKYIIVILLVCPVLAFSQANDEEQQLLQLKVYHLETQQQEQRIDQYLRNAYLPALHRIGNRPVGVFKPLEQDTTADKRVYVLTSFDSFQQFDALSSQLANDQQYQKAGRSFIQAPHDNPPYTKIETILLRAFPYAPELQVPDLNSPKTQRIYELRSYGSATEALNKNKVEMFNEGGEVELFAKLEFNAVFYGNVLAGSDMPNLMYMTTFEDMDSRDNHWDQFGNAPEWKEMSSMEKYQNNVSRIDIQFLHPTEYSDI